MRKSTKWLTALFAVFLLIYGGWVCGGSGAALRAFAESGEVEPPPEAESSSEPSSDPIPTPSSEPSSDPPPTSSSEPSSSSDPTPSLPSSTPEQTPTRTPAPVKNTPEPPADDPWEPEPEEEPEEIQETEQPVSEPASSEPAPSDSEASSALSSAVESSALSSAASSSALSLPDISGFPSAGTSVSVTTTQRSNLIGIICWVIIGIGILIVVIVLFRSTQKPGKGRRPGRKHYRRTKLKRTRKHLLADRYYKKSKYHSRYKR